jgi:hypothetical protein
LVFLFWLVRWKKPNVLDRAAGCLFTLTDNDRGLPQGWYFITVRPATEADRITNDEVNN